MQANNESVVKPLVASKSTAPSEPEDEIFLEGPRSRFAEFFTLLRVTANRGAKEAGGRSVGCTIELPSEQPTNAYLDRCVRMHYFFARKTLLVKYSYAFVVMPGGAGTLDELFEALTLIQTGKIKNFPIVIMGTDYWKELLYFIDKMAQRGMIAASDLKLIYATDSVDEAIAHIRNKAIEPFGLKPVMHHRRPIPLLGEG